VGQATSPANDRWLADTWTFVRTHLPRPPAIVVDLGCGPHGGFVPMLVADGYDALGIDPDAPEGERYRRIRFEDADHRQVDAVVACTSLHHVDDLDTVVGAIEAMLAPVGRLIVVEWAVEAFDERTARWCFRQLPAEPDDDGGWLRHQRDEFAASGATWTAYLDGWRSRENLHTGDAMLAALRSRFELSSLTRTPYFFPDLDLPKASEQAAIDAQRISATGLRCIGALPPRSPKTRE
jgi:SAM-dependent methyltransferase